MFCVVGKEVLERLQDRIVQKTPDFSKTALEWANSSKNVWIFFYICDPPTIKTSQFITSLLSRGLTWSSCKTLNVSCSHLKPTRLECGDRIIRSSEFVRVQQCSATGFNIKKRSEELFSLDQADSTCH